MQNLLGTSESYLQIGLAGPRLKRSTDALEARTYDDSAYAILRGLAPVGENDLSHKQYTDSKDIMYIGRQADCSAALPANTASREWVLVTTAGTGAVIGDVLFDDGTGVGTMVIVPATGRTIVTTAALAGGTIEFDNDSMYIWSVGTGGFIKIGDLTSLLGATRCMRFTIDTTASQDGPNRLPANYRISAVKLEIGTPYTGGTTIAIGSTVSPIAIMTTAQNTPTVADTYTVWQDTAWEAVDDLVRVTIAGGPVAGAGVVRVYFEYPI